MIHEFKLLHYTRGGPWHGRSDFGYRVWLDELHTLLEGNNPRAVCCVAHEHPAAPIAVSLAFRADHEGVN